MKFSIFARNKRSLYTLFIVLFHWSIRSEVAMKPQEPELPIVIITSSYNNAPWVIKYLDSVFMQEYNNFKLIYIDDCSNDGTADIVQAYVDWRRLNEKVTLIRNDARKLKLENIYSIIHGCNDTDIILILDGDDWFGHKNVLKKINHQYLNCDVWFTYGQSKFFPSGELKPKAQKVPLHILESRNFRQWKWVYRHPRTFYAWLFKLIKLKDLLSNEVPEFEGKFYPYCNDRAMIYPMLEMAQYHIGYIPAVAVIQNQLNSLSSQSMHNKEKGPNQIQQKCYAENVGRSPQYATLERPVINHLSQYDSAKADCLIFSLNNPVGLFKLLSTLEQHVKGIDRYFVIYQADDCGLQKAYQELQENFHCIQFNGVSIQELASIGNALKNEHILILSDIKKLDRIIDCSYAIRAMESTSAYVFDTTLSTTVLDNLGVPYQYIANGLFAWKFACDTKGQLILHHFNGSLYKKHVIINVFSNASGSMLNQLQIAWESIRIDQNNIGLFVDKK